MKYKDILGFNPSEIYTRLDGVINPFLRRNRIGVEQTFPDYKNGLCGCGCGEKLTGRRRRWASDECSKLPVTITSIINGDVSVIKPIVAYMYDKKCSVCGKGDEDFKRTVEHPVWKKNMTDREYKTYTRQYNKSVHDMASKIHLDHTLPVKKGGGGCWLSNYQLLCEECHKIKTKQE